MIINNNLTPTCCDITDLKIISRTLDVVDQNISNVYSFNNNIISVTDEFLVDYTLLFYNSYEGNINFDEQIIFFIIPSTSIKQAIKQELSISKGSNKYFVWATEAIPTKCLIGTQRILWGETEFYL